MQIAEQSFARLQHGPANHADPILIIARRQRASLRMIDVHFRPFVERHRLGGLGFGQILPAVALQAEDLDATNDAGLPIDAHRHASRIAELLEQFVHAISFPPPGCVLRLGEQTNKKSPTAARGYYATAVGLRSKPGKDPDRDKTINCLFDFVAELVKSPPASPTRARRPNCHQFGYGATNTLTHLPIRSISRRIC